MRNKTFCSVRSKARGESRVLEGCVSAQKPLLGSETETRHNCFVQENRRFMKLCNTEIAVVCTSQPHQAFHKIVTLISLISLNHW